MYIFVINTNGRDRAADAAGSLSGYLVHTIWIPTWQRRRREEWNRCWKYRLCGATHEYGMFIMQGRFLVASYSLTTMKKAGHHVLLPQPYIRRSVNRTILSEVPEIKCRRLCQFHTGDKSSNHPVISHLIVNIRLSDARLTFLVC